MVSDVLLHQTLSRAARRLRGLRAYQWAARSLCGAALLAVLWLLAARLGMLSVPTPLSIGSLLILSGLVGGLLGAARRLTPLEVARLTDGRTVMKDRLASAVEFAPHTVDDPLMRLQVDDAAAHAAAIDIRQVYPYRFSREMATFLLLALVLCGAFFLPTLPFFWSAEHRQEVELVKQQGVQIEKVAHDTVQNADAKRLDESRKAAQEARKLGAAMKRGELSKKDALIRMHRLTQQMEAQQKRMASANSAGAAKSMQQAAQEAQRALAESQRNRSLDRAAQKQGKTGEKSPEKAQGNPNGKQSPAMQQAQQALQKFADALTTQNAEQQNEALQQLADQMQKGGMNAQEMQQLQNQLQQLSEALKGTSLDKVSQQMAALAKQMQQISLDPETLKKLAEAMRQAGGT